MEIEIEDFYFTSKFDSGNLAKVQMVRVQGQSSCSGETSSDLYQCLRPEFRFNLWTKPDAAGTPYENSNRTWFHFGVQSKRRSCVVQYVLQNLNKQMRLYTQGMAPVYCIKPGEEYERIPHQPWFWLDGDQFYMSFIHLTPNNSSAVTYFAFTYPYSYEKLQRYLGGLDERFAHYKYYNSESCRDQIFYSRELVCHSLEQRNVDLLTITSCHGMTDQREPYLPCLFPLKESRPPLFQGKRIVFLTARVHPGETPSSYVLQGLLDFILSDTDILAYRLRKKFVFKIIPMLNPDGVALGHYRTDSRGVNLNRVYIDPIFEFHPSVFAVKTLILYHHVASRRGTISRSKKLGEKQNVKKMSKSVPTKKPLRLEVIGKALTISPEPDSKNDLLVTQDVKNKAKTIVDNLSRCSSTELDAGPSKLNHESRLANFGRNFQPEIVRIAMKWEHLDQVEVEENDARSVQNRGESCPVIAENIPPVPLSGMLQPLNDEWNTFVRSVLKIQGELSQTLKELHETFEVPSNENASSLRILPVTENEGEHSIGECSIKMDEISSDSGGSDRDCDSKSMKIQINSQTYGTHLKVPLFTTEISPNESGIAYYVDMHGHASRRGCFMYGNYFDDLEDKMDCMLLPKLLSINCSYFDFSSCVFSRKNMYCQDKKDGTTKLGCGRVAIYNMIRIIRSYTLECNYNTGVITGSFSTKGSSSIMQSTPPHSTYKPQVYEQVGRSLALTFLDIDDISRKGSRFSVNDCRSIPGVKDWLRQYIKASECGSRYMSYNARSSSPKGKSARQATSTAIIASPTKRQFRRRRPFTTHNVPVTVNMTIPRVASHVIGTAQKKALSTGNGDRKTKMGTKKKNTGRHKTVGSAKKKSNVSTSSSDATVRKKKIKTFCGIKYSGRIKKDVLNNSTNSWSSSEERKKSIDSTVNKKSGNKLKKGKFKTFKNKIF